MKTVLFVCVHNAGRSQMAEAYFNHLAASRHLPMRAQSAGTVGGSAINPVAAQVMAEIGVPMDGQRPKRLTQTMADAADRIITMGCGVDADACPARLLVTEDWGLDDPKDRPIETVREIRDQMRARVERLLSEIEAMPDEETENRAAIPLACGIGAFTAEQQNRYRALETGLHPRVQEVRELPDGYAFRFSSEQKVCRDVMAFITLERLCCPFFTFALELAPQHGPLTLSLTGPEGAKEILRRFSWVTPKPQEPGP